MKEKQIISKLYSDGKIVESWEEDEGHTMHVVECNFANLGVSVLQVPDSNFQVTRIEINEECNNPSKIWVRIDD